MALTYSQRAFRFGDSNDRNQKWIVKSSNMRWTPFLRYLTFCFVFSTWPISSSNGSGSNYDRIWASFLLCSTINNKCDLFIRFALNEDRNRETGQYQISKQVGKQIHFGGNNGRAHLQSSKMPNPKIILNWEKKMQWKYSNCQQFWHPSWII